MRVECEERRMASVHVLFDMILVTALCIVISAQGNGSALPVLLVRADHYHAGLLIVSLKYNKIMNTIINI